MKSVSCDPIVTEGDYEEYSEPKQSPPNGVCLSLLEWLRIWFIRLGTFPRDLRGLSRYLTLKYRIYRAQKNNQSVPKLFQQIVQKDPQKIAFYFEDETWTFKQVDELSNKVGNYFASQGVKHGDAIALFMENCVEYICIWLGLCK
ncbi:hypothetical protein SK128_012332, partial [Halocaridina rubra]